MTQTRKKRLLWALCLAALALFAAAMVWLHYQQLCSPGGGSDPLTTASFNGNLADGSAFAAVCFLCLRQKCESSCA